MTARSEAIERCAHALMACMIKEKREGMKFWSVGDEDALDALRAALAATEVGCAVEADPDLRARIELVMQLRQVERERDYLLNERTRHLRELADCSEILFDLLDEPGLPDRLREKIREFLNLI